MVKSLITVAVATVFLLTISACSSDSKKDAEKDVKDILDKDSVELSNLDAHDVTYENAAGGATHTDRYCPNGMLGDKVGVDGTWTVAGNDLTVNDTTNGRAFTHQTDDAELEKGESYTTTTSETFKVTVIAETLACL